MTENPLRKTVYVCVIITIAAAAMIFMPEILGVEGMNGGYAISFVSFFAVIMGIIVVIVYNGLASRLDKILSGENLLAHWIYTPQMWREYAEKEYGVEKTEKKALFYVVSGISLFVGVLFFAFNPKAGFYVLVSMLVLALIIGLISVVTSRQSYRQNVKHLGEAYVARNGVYLNRQFYYWNFLTSRLEKVALKNEKGLMLLSITFWAWTKTFGPYYTVRIPVPSGQEEKAREIVSQLTLERK